MWIRELSLLWWLGLEDSGNSIKPIYVFNIQSLCPDCKAGFWRPPPWVKGAASRRERVNLLESGKKLVRSVSWTLGPAPRVAVWADSAVSWSMFCLVWEICKSLTIQCSAETQRETTTRHNRAEHGRFVQRWRTGQMVVTLLRPPGVSHSAGGQSAGRRAAHMIKMRTRTSEFEIYQIIGMKTGHHVNSERKTGYGRFPSWESHGYVSCWRTHFLHILRKCMYYGKA